MAKVTVHHEPKTPSQQVIKSANELIYVTDSKGRKLGLRRLDFLEEFRIMEAVGAELASNQTYMGMLNPLLFLAEIDGEPVEIPRNKRQIEALIQRAGREGFVAVFEGVVKHFSVDQKELEDKIKNVVGTQDSETDSGS
jgi:hypothetical protein